MNTTTAADVEAVQAISAVPTILRVVSETTGLRFVCVARVTEDSWTTCSVHDKLGFGLQPGDPLDVATTLCDTVRSGNKPIVIDKVSDDPVYCNHPTPRMYGFESYISVPVYRGDGEFFGTLCGLDPLPAHLSDSKTIDTLTLFAKLISCQLESERRLSESETALLGERSTSELREQFIGVLGHDLRTPLSSILTGTELLQRTVLDPHALDVVERIQRSGKRISSLVDDVVDFTRGRMGGGIPLNVKETTDLPQHLRHVVAELKDVHANRAVLSEFEFADSIVCDPKRIAQLLSNLLVNALIYGAAREPVRVAGYSADGGMVLSVSNRGTPITPEKMAKLFQPFWRGDNRGKANGLGLGLYIASEIAYAHGGVLQVTSTAEATTFTFTMPRMAGT